MRVCPAVQASGSGAGAVCAPHHGGDHRQRHPGPRHGLRAAHGPWAGGAGAFRLRQLRHGPVLRRQGGGGLCREAQKRAVCAYSGAFLYRAGYAGHAHADQPHDHRHESGADGCEHDAAPASALALRGDRRDGDGLHGGCQGRADLSGADPAARAGGGGHHAPDAARSPQGTGPAGPGAHPYPRKPDRRARAARLRQAGERAGGLRRGQPAPVPHAAPRGRPVGADEPADLCAGQRRAGGAFVERRDGGTGRAAHTGRGSGAGQLPFADSGGAGQVRKPDRDHHQIHRVCRPHRKRAEYARLHAHARLARRGRRGRGNLRAL